MRATREELKELAEHITTQPKRCKRTKPVKRNRHPRGSAKWQVDRMQALDTIVRLSLQPGERRYTDCYYYSAQDRREHNHSLSQVITIVIEKRRLPKAGKK